MQCSHCGFNAPAEMNFCGQCGARLGVPCPQCGFENPAGYRFCGKCGRGLTVAPATAAAEGAVAPLVGERRIATVILADVYRSTDLMEQLGTEVWVELMNQALQLLAAEVYRFGGRVDQFRGDGLVAFFGATDAHEDDPERAILAALAMHGAIRPCAETVGRQGIDLKIRVGVNTGEVIVGSVGEASRHREDTAMGGGIALAARMETAAEPGTVLVSADTYRLVEGRFEWLPLGEISVKGISKPVAVYRPLRLRTFGEVMPATHDLALPLVFGCNEAFATLQRCVEALCGGRGGIAFVTGAKGMGKSLLVERLQQHFAHHVKIGPPAAPSQAEGAQHAAAPAGKREPGGGGFTWLTTHCRSYDQTTPYAMWVGLLRNWLEAPTDDNDPDLAARLRQECATLWGEQAERYCPYLATLLALPVTDTFAERMAYIQAEGLQKQLSGAVYTWMEALAQRGPTVLAFNDLQFADASSLNLLRHCLPICENTPVLWLASFRPDRGSLAWEFRHYAETEYGHRLTAVDLPPLTESESRALLDQMLGHDTLAEATAALIVAKAEGNPYYMREILYALVGQGVLHRDAGGLWRQTQPVESFDLPGSLRGLLLARIDRLSPEARRVLQAASVIGSTFWRNVLEALIEDVSQVKSALTQLQRSQLIQEQSLEPELGMAYTFTPSLVREVVYESLLSSQRALYHRRVAEKIEALFGADSSKPYHGLLAYHYRRAGDLNRELYYVLGAAEEAQRVYANGDAHSRYTRALELLAEIESQSPPEALRPIWELSFEALMGRHQVQVRMGNITAARADACALLPLARRMADDPAFMVDALLHQPQVHSHDTREELETGLKMAREALVLAQGLGDKRREMHALVAVAELQLLRKDPSWLTLGDQAYELSRQLGDLRMQVGLLLGISDALGMDDLQRGSEYLEAALEISQRVEDKETEASLLAAIGPRFERKGDYYQQLVEYDQKRAAIYHEIGNSMGEGHALMFCGQIRAIYLGDFEGGLALMHEALARWSETSDKLFPLLRIAQIQAAQGRFDEAWATLAAARAAGEHVILDIGHAGLALVEAITHNTQGGPEHWRRVLGLQATIQQMVKEDQLSRQYQMAAACETAEAHLRLAQQAEDGAERAEHQRLALEASGAALAIYRQFGFTQIVECVAEEILYRHSLALAANGRDADAREMLKAAYAEMMRKHDLIPADSPFRKAFLENIALHRQIAAARQHAQGLEIPA